MNKLDEINEKINEIRKDKNDLDTHKRVIQTLFPLYRLSEIRVRDAVVDNSTAILDEVSRSISDNIGQSTDEIIKSLDDLSKSIDNNNDKQVIQELRKIYVGIQGMESKPYFDEKQFQSIFEHGMNKIANILIDRDDIPLQTEYNRDASGRIQSVIEIYENYRLSHRWTYDRNDKLVKVVTTKT